MKIIDATWFTQMAKPNTIGIVIVEDEVTGEKTAYIGTAGGDNIEEDMQKIAGTGAKLHPRYVNEFLERNEVYL